MPVDINNLSDGWLELESDPGLFTLLLENMGVKGIQVEEIYDLQKGFEGKVFGFIFLFKWIEERRSRRKIVENFDNYVRDENIVNTMFFAQQMVPNSCATHSLVSVLLNCSNLDLGPTLSRLRAHTLGMSPENKGWAIGNTPELANAHNSHAAPQARRRQDKTPGVPTSSRMSSNAETFHFVSYVPVRGHLFELDGLKPHPLDHGPWAEGEDWTEKFRRVITERLGIATGGEPYHDIRFNLMAVVPDKITAHRQKLVSLKRNRDTVMEALHIFIQYKYPQYVGKENVKVEQPKKEYEVSNNLSLLAVAASQELESQGYSNDDQINKKEMDVDEEKTDSPGAKTETYNSRSRLQVPGGRLVTCHSSDYATPLTIETSSPAHPATPSTDTASEVGSAFNSPQLCSEGSTQSSPAINGTYQRLVVVRMAHPAASTSSQSAIKISSAAEEKIPHFTGTEDIQQPVITVSSQAEYGSVNAQSHIVTKTSALLDDAKDVECKPIVLHPLKDLDDMEELPFEDCEDEDTMLDDVTDDEFQFSPKEMEKEDLKKFIGKDLDIFESVESLENGDFAPSDLLRLINILNSEIELSEAILKDELEKRKRYRIDDCRRTHNYDQFIITFLAMLAEQGQLGDLVKEQLQPTRKRHPPQPLMSRHKSNVLSTKKIDTKSSPGSILPFTTNKKRGRKKKAKGKRKR